MFIKLLIYFLVNCLYWLFGLILQILSFKIGNFFCSFKSYLRAFKSYLRERSLFTIIYVTKYRNINIKCSCTDFEPLKWNVAVLI